MLVGINGNMPSTPRGYNTGEADMTIRKNIRENPPDSIHYGYFNYGSLVGVAKLRRQAVREAERWLEKPWSEIKDDIEIHKIRVSKA